MEWCVELREGKRDGAVEPPDSGPNIQFLPASEQLYTRSCSRCAGLLVNEWCHDLLDDTGGLSIEVLRCVQCGQHVDPVILRNRIRAPVTDYPATRAPRVKSAGIPMSCEAA
ncbi:MAG: hypothetical protein ACREI2_05655 [Nitrospiraceae bacterium]